jgi:hypothetical protein
MVFGFMVTRALLVLVGVFGRLPAPVSKLFAAILNTAARPFHTINYWGSLHVATDDGVDRSSDTVTKVRRPTPRRQQRRARRISTVSTTMQATASTPLYSTKAKSTGI